MSVLLDSFTDSEGIVTRTTAHWGIGRPRPEGGAPDWVTSLECENESTAKDTLARLIRQYPDTYSAGAYVVVTRTITLTETPWEEVN